MAANLDKSENSLTSVSTLTYLRGIDASGNSVKISTSDLASVLGVPVSGNVGTTDLNTFISNGVYHSGDRNPTNGPIGAGYGLLCVFRGPGNHTAQRYIDIENGNKSYQRSCVDLVGSTWSDWILEYDHNLLSNSTELRSLASALGVGSKIVRDTDLNSLALPDLSVNVISAFKDNSVYSDLHFPKDVAQMLVLDVRRDSSVGFQFALPMSQGSIYFRSHWGSWSSWKQITLT